MESKRPWSVWLWNSRVRIKGADGNTVLGIIDRAEDKDNAALIVKCVNAHDGLVEALKEAKEEIIHLCRARYIECTEAEATADIDAALKAAGVEL